MHGKLLFHPYVSTPGLSRQPENIIALTRAHTQVRRMSRAQKLRRMSGDNLFAPRQRWRRQGGGHVETKVFVRLSRPIGARARALQTIHARALSVRHRNATQPCVRSTMSVTCWRRTRVENVQVTARHRARARTRSHTQMMGEYTFKGVLITLRASSRTRSAKTETKFGPTTTHPPSPPPPQTPRV